MNWNTPAWFPAAKSIFGPTSGLKTLFPHPGIGSSCLVYKTFFGCRFLICFDFVSFLTDCLSGRFLSLRLIEAIGLLATSFRVLLRRFSTILTICIEDSSDAGGPSWIVIVKGLSMKLQLGSGLITVGVQIPLAFLVWIFVMGVLAWHGLLPKFATNELKLAIFPRFDLALVTIVFLLISREFPQFFAPFRRFACPALLFFFRILLSFAVIFFNLLSVSVLFWLLIHNRKVVLNRTNWNESLPRSITSHQVYSVCLASFRIIQQLSTRNEKLCKSVELVVSLDEEVHNELYKICHCFVPRHAATWKFHLTVPLGYLKKKFAFSFNFSPLNKQTKTCKKYLLSSYSREAGIPTQRYLTLFHTFRNSKERPIKKFVG